MMHSACSCGIVGVAMHWAGKEALLYRFKDLRAFPPEWNTRGDVRKVQGNARVA